MVVMNERLGPQVEEGRYGIGVPDSHPWLGRLLSNTSTLGYFLISPILIVILGLIAYPFFSALWLSFHHKVTGMRPIFIGLENYMEILREPLFRQAALNTIEYALSADILKLVIGMATALALNQDFRGRNVVRGLILIPWVAPVLVSALAWRWIYDDANGILNHIVFSLHLIDQPILWLGNIGLAMPAVIAVNVWHGFPFFAVNLLAGLQSIPKDLYEAAEVDGASGWQCFWHVTVPGLKNVIIVITLLSLIWNVNEFQQIYILTRGGPANATQVFATLTHEIAFYGMKLGQAAAIPIILMPVLVTIIILLTRYMTRSEES